MTYVKMKIREAARKEREPRQYETKKETANRD